MRKLTSGQHHALSWISEAPGKSGRFWRDLGVTPQVIAGLETLGLVGAQWRQATGETSILTRAWNATDAGRAALEASRTEREREAG